MVGNGCSVLYYTALGVRVYRRMMVHYEDVRAWVIFFSSSLFQSAKGKRRDDGYVILGLSLCY